MIFPIQLGVIFAHTMQDVPIEPAKRLFLHLQLEQGETSWQDGEAPYGLA
jgi:hypothetical protein